MPLVFDFLIITGINATLFIVWVLLKKVEKRLHHSILIGIVFLLFTVLLHTYGEFHDVPFIKYTTYFLSDSIGFLLGPLLFIYIKSLFSKSKHLIQQNLLHFIPFGIYLLFISIPFFITNIQGQYLFSYLKFIDQHDYLFHIQAIYLAFYSLKSLSLLRSFQYKITHSFSNIEGKDLDWVKCLLIGILTVLFFDITLAIYHSFVQTLNWDIGFLPDFILVGVVLYLGYFGTTQARILMPDFILKDVSLLQKKPSTHHLSNTPFAEIEQLKTRLNDVLKNEKPYLNESLTLDMLADSIPTSNKKLSALLNQYLNISFYDLINNHRVEEVKTKIDSKKFDHYTLLAIAFDSGFNSKTSFNRIFKKTTNYSPSQYKKKLN